MKTVFHGVLMGICLVSWLEHLPTSHLRVLFCELSVSFSYFSVAKTTVLAKITLTAKKKKLLCCCFSGCLDIGDIIILLHFFLSFSLMIIYGASKFVDLFNLDVFELSSFS